MGTESVRIFGKGWNFSQDGPGNRLIYHFQGCNFFCPWCSNPEGIAPGGTLMVKADKLTDTVCPHGAIVNRKLDRRMCELCADRPCLGRNRNEGITWSCREYGVGEIVEEIESCRSMFHGGGGVTITGGEPTLQFRPLKTLLERVKASAVNVAVETNGTHPRLPELFGSLDLLIMDMKHYDPVAHRRVIGAENELTLSNLRKAAAAEIEMWIRIPLIPGFNDGRERIERFAGTIAEFRGDRLSVELLPCHEYGRIKWEQAGMPYRAVSRTIAADELDEYRKIFTGNGIRVINT